VSDASDHFDDSPDTLYDVPIKNLEDVPAEVLGETSDEGDQVALQLLLPPDRADRLRAVAQQIGLTPSLVVERAIELVCDEVVTIQDDARPMDVMLDQYQARIDLLHSVGASEENGKLELPSSSDPSNDG
jgi:hypothetical protein